MYSDHCAHILTAVAMGRSGKLARIWDAPRVQLTEPAQAAEAGETLKPLEQLGELRDKGIISEQEFEAKKKEEGKHLAKRALELVEDGTVGYTLITAVRG